MIPRSIFSLDNSVSYGSAIAVHPFFLRFFTSQTGQIIVCGLRCVSICNHDAELLCVLVSDLEDTVHVRITEKFNKSGTLGRIQTDFDRCSLRVNVTELQCKEVTRTPLAGNLAAVIKVFQCSCYSCAGHGHVSVLNRRNGRVINLA